MSQALEKPQKKPIKGNQINQELEDLTKVLE